MLLLTCRCGCAALHPPHPTRLLPLLANHHTTLLYLGHSNVLLLSPLADALCSNLRKIGWEEEKSEESGRREGVVTGARSSLPSKKKSNLLFCDFPPVQYLSLPSSSRRLSLHPDLSPREVFVRPTAAAGASFHHRRLSLPLAFIHELIHTVPKSSMKSSPALKWI